MIWVCVLKKLINANRKKIAQTDAIFSYAHSVNQIADQTDGVIRISIDTKANVNVGAYSRGGYSRQAVKAADHDFGPEMVLKPFGIFLPAYNENYFYFTDGNVTADFMIDAIKFLFLLYNGRCQARFGLNFQSSGCLQFLEPADDNDNQRWAYLLQNHDTKFLLIPFAVKNLQLKKAS